MIGVFVILKIINFSMGIMQGSIKLLVQIMSSNSNIKVCLTEVGVCYTEVPLYNNKRSSAR